MLVANFSPGLRASILVVENSKLVRFGTISGCPMCFHLLLSWRRESLFVRLDMVEIFYHPVDVLGTFWNVFYHPVDVLFL